MMMAGRVVARSARQQAAKSFSTVKAPGMPTITSFARCGMAGGALGGVCLAAASQGLAPESRCEEEDHDDDQKIHKRVVLTEVGAPSHTEHLC